jgi:hypothetical protein
MQSCACTKLEKKIVDRCVCDAPVVTLLTYIYSTIYIHVYIINIFPAHACARTYEIARAQRIVAMQLDHIRGDAVDPCWRGLSAAGRARCVLVNNFSRQVGSGTRPADSEFNVEAAGR